MPIAVLVYLVVAALVFWAYCGYLVSLILLSDHRGGRREPEASDDFPSVAILVPCHNEADLVEAKVRNLASLDYPDGRSRVLFLDGGSDDATRENILRHVADRLGMEFVATGARGKIPQLNTAFPGLVEDVVVCTDMDAVLDPNVLRKLVAVLVSDPSVAVAGAKVMPLAASRLEAQYWEDQNVIRLLESEVHSASIVIAPCYAFRRGLIEAFPDDCIADDIHVSFTANTRGFKVKYVDGAGVLETRAPHGFAQLVAHKFRKGNGYLRELFRFAGRASGMSRKWRAIFLTKFLQVVVMPWALVLFGAVSAAFALARPPLPLVVALTAAFLFASLTATSVLMGRERRRLTERPHRRSLVAVFLFTNFILLLNGLTYPFYHPTSRFPKVGRRTGGSPAR